MQFTIDTYELQRALRVIGGVAKPNPSETSGYVVIEATGDGNVVFLSTNSSLSVTSVVKKCNIITAGTICVSYGKLSSHINFFSPFEDYVGVKDLEFKSTKQGMSVKTLTHFADGTSSKGKLNFRTYDAYRVAVPTPFVQADFVINAAILRIAIAKVGYAINASEQRAFMQGMNLRFTEDNIYFAGTDARKLSEYKVKNSSKKKDGSYIVPYKFITSLRKIVDAESPVFFQISDKNIKASIGNDVLYSTIISGHEYPDYAPLLQKYTDIITINKDVILNSFVPFLNTLADNDDNSRVTIEMSEGKLKVVSDFSESEYDGDISFKGDFVIDINGGFLSQTLNSIKDDLVKIKFSDSTGPLLFDSANFGDQASLITPIKRRTR